MLEIHEDVLSVLAGSYIFGLNFGWLYQVSKAERTNYVESLTVNEVQGASWLFATHSTCEEEHGSVLFTFKVCDLPWVSHREKGSQASTLLPGATPFDAELQRSSGSQETVCTDLPR